MHDTGTSAAGDGGAPAAASCKSSKTGIQSAAAAGKRGSRTSVEAAQLLKLTRKKKKNKKPKLPQGKPPQKKRLAAGEYLVESLLERRDYDHWRMGQIVQYKVKWVGYPMSKCTWEPSWTLPPELIFQFNNPELERERSNAKPEFIVHPDAAMFQCSGLECQLIESRPAEFLCCLPCLAAAGGQPSIGEIDDRPRCVPAVPLTQELGLVPRYCSKACQQSHWPQHKGVCSVPLPGSVAHPNREECESTERAQ